MSDVIEINAAGGKQSALDTRCDLFPPRALLEVARVLKRGSRYGKDNWRLIDRSSHLNHALTHILQFLQGDRSDNHLPNAACRLLMALETEDWPDERQAAEPQADTLPFTAASPVILDARV